VTSAPSPSEPNFSHLLAMTDERGTFEHALFRDPRPEHGYCTDDMARVLVVATREPNGSPQLRHLAVLGLRFLLEALEPQGKCRNRMNRRGAWDDRPTLDDCWGRCILGLGTAAAHSDDDAIRHRAARGLEQATRPRSPWPRAMAFAALGTAELLSVYPDNESARTLLDDAADSMTRASGDTGWTWPEDRLSYANATLPEAMIAAGSALHRPVLVKRGLDLLEWLLERECQQGHLSVTSVGGSGPGDHGPRFDQQPIEVAAMADACARAMTVDSNRLWMDGVMACANWFQGDNDGSVVMWDPETGGAFDGLEADGANLNQGTESTLALLSTLQHARSLVSVSQ
jgi:hypothetical protein